MPRLHIPYWLRGWVIPNPKSITVRLKLAVGLLIAAIVGVSCASLLYARQAHLSAQTIERGVEMAQGSRADIAVLIERHRRLIDETASTADAAALDKARQRVEHLNSLIVSLFRKDREASFRAAADQFLALVNDARAAFAAAQARDESSRRVAVQSYHKKSNALHDVVRDSRKVYLSEAATMLKTLSHRGERLQWWIIATTLTALLVIGPISLLIVAKTMRRIRVLTYGMRRVALNDTAVNLGSVSAGDEIGEMARALEVFKHNAQTVAGSAREIRRLNEWFDMALKNMAHGLSMFNAEGRMLVCNRRYLELYRLPDHLGIPGTPIADIAAYWRSANTDSTVDTGRDPDPWFAALQRMIVTGTAFSQRHELDDGRIIIVSVQPLSDGGWVDVHEDVTDAETAEKRIAELARFDALTGLANRHYFQELLEASLSALPPEQSVAVLGLDLDRLKHVNDFYGHPVGDALLKSVAQRLRSTTRDGDVVARLGSDEFAIILQATTDSARASQSLGERIIKLLNEPFEILGHKVSIGASIGVAIAPQHGTAPDDLLHNADIALYRAKTAGRGTVVFYTSEFETTIRARRKLEADLRYAVRNGELMLYYQPIVDLSENCVTACEALMRWRHKDLGMVPPNDFIPMAEELGLIGELGAWAIKQACRDAATWQNDVRVAVNLSADQFSKRNLVDITRSALTETGIDPKRLEFEVTETLLLQDNAGTLQTLEELRGHGVSIALDDFGTGYASLSYLSRFPFDKIKIDQSFIRALPSGGDSATIVRAIVDLVHTLGMKCVAEGVETADELRHVRRKGCDYVQGYYFSPPVPAGDIGTIIDRCNGRLNDVAA